jgi:hypothetical protein
VPVLPGQFPSKQDIADKSKTDLLGKFLTCLQILWFLAQSIARVSQGFSISLLEVSTISYICLAFISFNFWMTKPFNVNTPTVLDATTSTVPLYIRTDEITFKGAFSGPLITLLVWGFIVGCFTGVHCAAWYYQFPTVAEAWIWRVSAILCFVLPLPFIQSADADSGTYIYNLGTYILFSYILVRLCLIVEVFAAFRSSPASIYAEVNWSRYWGHFG